MKILKLVSMIGGLIAAAIFSAGADDAASKPVPVPQTGAAKSYSTLVITVTDPGSGYTSAPVVTITPNAGVNLKANAKATVADGKVTSVIIVGGGSSYSATTPPTVQFSGGGGTGAAATAAVIVKQDDYYWAAKGAGTPLPSSRFTDNKNGTVTDNKTGLIWLANLNAFGEVTWADAITDCNTLASGAHGLTDDSKAGDWRLPNVNELRSLCNYGFRPALPSDKGDTAWGGKSPSTFTDFQGSHGYWTSTPFLGKPGSDWAINIGFGITSNLVSHRNDHMPTLLMHVAPVRGTGTTGPSPVSQTGATATPTSATDHDDAYWAGKGVGVPLPNPRFTDNKNGTVTDNKTGLVWLANADAFGEVTPDQAIDACNKLASGAHGLNDGSKPGDWRLPNLNEMQSLINYAFTDPLITNDKGDAKWSAADVGKTCSISGVVSGWYWTSTTTMVSPDRTWGINLGTGIIHFEPSMSDHVWPVRSGK